MRVLGIGRSAVAAVSVTVAVAAVTGAASRVHAAPSAPSGLALLSDVRASHDPLGSPRQASTPNDYIQPDTEIEPSIAVNPRNPLNAVAVFQQGRVDAGGDATNGFATTVDGGLSWTSGQLPGLTSFPGQGGTFDRASDAVVAFGPDGEAYASSLVFDDASTQGLRSGMALNVSKDGGRTWGPPVIFQDDMIGGFNDKNWVVVDQSDAPGHHRGRVYVVWDKVVAGVVYDYCDHDCDQLSNWLPTLQTAAMPVWAGQGIGTYPLVLPSGALAVVYDTNTDSVPPDPAGLSAANGELVVSVAPAAGTQPYPTPLVFLPPVAISPYDFTGVRTQRAGGLPSAAVDQHSGDIYVTWEDQRFRTDAANDALLSVSHDGGSSWSAPVRVDGGPTGDEVDHYNTMVSVAPDGAVYVGYMQRQEAATGPRFSPRVDTVVQVSHDGGATFSAPLVIAAPGSDAYHAAFSRDGIFEGDYNELAAVAGRVYVVREQAFPAYPGEPEALTPNPDGSDTLVLSGKGHQHQTTWVAVLATGAAGGGAVLATTAQTPAPTPTPSASGVTVVQPGGGTANTAADGGDAGRTTAAALALLGLVVVATRRRRRPRPG